MSQFELPLEFFAKEWVMSFEKSPTLTIVLSLVATVSIATGFYFTVKTDKEKRETQRLQNLNYQTQIQQLNQTEANIKQFLQFVESQKTTFSLTLGARMKLIVKLKHGRG